MILAAFTVIASIPLYSTFTGHLSISYLPLLILVPIILYVTKESAEDRAPTSFSNYQLSLLTLIGLLGFVVLFLGPEGSIVYYTQYLLLFCFIVPAIIAILAFKIPFRNLGFRANRTDLKVAILCGIIYGVLVFLMVGYGEFNAILDIFGPYTRFIPSVLPQAIVLACIISIFGIALPEEFFFRTLLQSSFSERLGSVHGILLASLVFGLFHVPTNFMVYYMIYGDSAASLLYALIITFIAQSQVGLILGIAWHRTRSLMLPVTLHAIHDIIEMLPLFIVMFLPGFVHF